MFLAKAHPQKSTTDRLLTNQQISGPKGKEHTMQTLTTPLCRLARWFHLRRSAWRGFNIDLGDLSLDEHDIYLDLASGRD